MATETNLTNLVINELTRAQYDAAKSAGTINDDEIYLITDETGLTYDEELSTTSENAVQNKVIKAAIDGIKYAGASTAGGAATSANKVVNKIIVKLNGGTTEGTNMFTFDGSAAKTIDLTPDKLGVSSTIIREW